MAQASEKTNRLIEVVIDEAVPARRSADAEHERRVAIYDLIEENHFLPNGCGEGPFILRLSLIEGRLWFDIGDAQGQPVTKVALPLQPFRSLLRDYSLICESYHQAIKNAPRSRIEAIDMGRRGIHNEGSELLIEKLEGQIEIDLDTARRLFTLVFVMQMRG
ncbi:MAG: UPF0262 family protein [Alphaproteobacteria bacterium]|nr:UPF0262 family protein [Alphaproteobacteria bacterium]